MIEWYRDIIVSTEDTVSFDSSSNLAILQTHTLKCIANLIHSKFVLQNKIIIVRMGFEPMRTFVHWNLSPTP